MKRKIDMETASCAICASSLRSEIEKNGSVWKDAATVQWARKQGVNITRFTLAKHRANHLGVSSGNGCGKDIEMTSEENSNHDHGLANMPLNIPRKKSGSIGRVLKKRRTERARPCSASIHESQDTSVAPQSEIIDAAQDSKPPVAIITDQLLLDAVRDQVYKKLVNGEIELDIGDGFKAIEIRHKIAEESQNEKLLLEILNEIRSEELAIKRDSLSIRD
jgi:hypothetical protein